MKITACVRVQHTSHVKEQSYCFTSPQSVVFISPFGAIPLEDRPLTVGARHRSTRMNGDLFSAEASRFVDRDELSLLDATRQYLGAEPLLMEVTKRPWNFS